MRRFFSLTSVFLTLLCIANLFFPLGSIPVLFSIITLVFVFILYKLSKTTFKKNLPKVLAITNVVVAIIFLLKPVLVKDKVEIEAAVQEERKEKQKDAIDELNLLETEGVLDAVQETEKKPDTPPTNEELPSDSQTITPPAPKEDEIEFDQPAFN